MSGESDEMVVEALVCGRCGSDRVGDGADGYPACGDCGEQTVFIEIRNERE